MTAPLQDRQAFSDRLAASLAAEFTTAATVISDTLPLSPPHILFLHDNGQFNLCCYSRDGQENFLHEALRALDDIQASQHWLRHLFAAKAPAHHDAHPEVAAPVRLTLVTATTLPGSALLERLPEVALYTFRVTGSDSAPTLLLLPAAHPPAPGNDATRSPLRDRTPAADSGLSAEEADFFDNLEL